MQSPAVKADKTKALDVFNKGGGGFNDRDLYVFCANGLPAPKGPFFIAMRLYWPKQAALDGTWKQPPTTKKP
jgi:hypothetical protein